jgi:pyridoxine 5-phosphate synthase
MKRHTKLSVNINKFATIRNARGGNNPNILAVAKDCELFGAEGITVHPRPDERHIRYQDVLDLSKSVRTEFNIEGYPSRDFIELVLAVKPQQVTLVPDPPDAITSNAGWDAKLHLDFLSTVIAEIKTCGARVSLFLEPNPEMVIWAKKTGADRIELYTESYAKEYNESPEKAILPYMKTAEEAVKCDIGLNAGHDLDLNNIHYFTKHIPNLLEVSIGHALVCDALYHGLQNTIQMYLSRMTID